MNCYLWKKGNEFTAAKRSATSVIGCSVEWQPPHVPQQLYRGYNNKPLCERRQIKTTEIKVHHIITWFSGKLPPPSTASTSTCCFEHFCILLFSSTSSLFSFTLTSSCFHRVNPLKIPLHPKGGARRFHLPSLPPSPRSCHICSSPRPPPPPTGVIQPSRVLLSDLQQATV